MKKRSRNIINSGVAVLFWLGVIFLWQFMSRFGGIPRYLLPSPSDIVTVLFTDKDLLITHTAVTLFEALAGLVAGIAAAFLFAILMDVQPLVKAILYPAAVVSQTIPVVAIAPLLVIWLGFGVLPKVSLVFLVCFFPILISLYDGFQSVDSDMINLFVTMGAGKFQIFKYVKLPYALRSMFSGLRIAVSYSVVGGVISEWIGGKKGLGVYMTRTMKSFDYDKMFAAVLVVMITSLLLMKILDMIDKKINRHANG